MAYSSLKRKTPLKAKTPLKSDGGFRARQTGGKNEKALPSDKSGKKPADGAKGGKSAGRQTRNSLETHLDIVFSLFIRLRDAMEGGMCKCISCGRVLPFSQIQCGHYFGRANMSTRWDEDNCNAECVHCNCYDDDHLVLYKLNLIRKIGVDAYDALCARAHGMRKWSGDELRAMVKRYTAEARRLSREKGIKVKI